MCSLFQLFHSRIGEKEWSHSTLVLCPGSSGVSADVMSEGFFQSFCSTLTRGDSNFSLANSGQQQDAIGFSRLIIRTIPDALNMQKQSVSRKILHRRQETVNFFFQELSPYHWVILSFPTSCNLSNLWAFYDFAVALLCCFAIFTHCKQSDGWGAVNIPWHLSWCQPSGRPLFPVLTTKLTHKTSENVRCLCCCVAAKTVW